MAETNVKILKCAHCGNIFDVFNDAGVTPICCGEAMQTLVPGEIDAATEKHVPFVEVKDGVATVQIGEVIHPMDDDHYIEFIIIEEGDNYQLKFFSPGDTPKAEFKLVGDGSNINVFEYCNKHGLWKK